MKLRGVLSLFLATLIGCGSEPYTANGCDRPPEIAYFARHALKVGTDGEGLCKIDGLKQANALRDKLLGEGITHIYTTDILRTGQTAMPLAQALSLTPVQIKRSTPVKQVEMLCNHDEHDRVLVVGHSDRLPLIVSGLGFDGINFDYCEFYKANYVERSIVKIEYYDKRQCQRICRIDAERK